SEEDITECLSQQFGVPSISLVHFEIDPSVIKLIPADVARKYNILPVNKTGATITIAMADPTNVFAMDDIKFMTGYNVEPVVASESAVSDAIQKYYSAAKGKRGGESAPAGPGGPSTLEMASRGLEELQASLDDTAGVEVLEELEEISAEALAKQGEEA